MPSSLLLVAVGSLALAVATLASAEDSATTTNTSTSSFDSLSYTPKPFNETEATSIEPYRIPLERAMNAARSFRLGLPKVQRVYKFNSTLETISRANGIQTPYADVTLTDYAGVQYYGPIGVGTPSRQYTVIYDTGSSDLWIPGQQCSDCGNKPKYNPRSSSTYKRDGRSFDVRYGSGPVSGTLATETMHLGDITIPSQSFALISSTKGLGSLYKNANWQGILGLAFRKLARHQIIPFAANLFNTNPSMLAVFSYYLPSGNANSKPELIFGAVDRRHYSGYLQQVKLLDTIWWLVRLTSVRVGSTTVTSNAQAIIDSGTSLLVIPTQSLRRLTQIFHAQAYQGSDTYLVNCRNMFNLPSIVVTLSQTSWELRPDDYIMQDQGTCILAVGDAGSGDNQWILGDVFMRRVYTVFDYANKAVHLGYASEQWRN